MERKHEKRLVGCDELARIIEQFGEQERELELDLTPKMRVAALCDFLQQYMDGDNKPQLFVHEPQETPTLL